MLGGLSPWHLLILAVIALLVFGGRGKISGIMGDAAKGIKAFREGLKDDHDSPPTQTTPSLPPANEAPKDPIAR
jgi:sec-independent protein translocase protein TatA